MLFTRLKFITLILFVLAAVATGVGLSSQSLAGRRDEPAKSQIGPPREAAAPAERQDRLRLRAGCSLSAACSTRKGNRCRTRP